MLIREIDNDRQSMDVDSNLFYRAGSRDTIVKEKESLSLIVDEPCLRACEYLFDCNIRTLNSSANKYDKIGYIAIDYRSLDEDNKKVYWSLVQEGLISPKDLEEKEEMVGFSIEIPIYDTTTVAEFSQRILEIAMRFNSQDLLYGYYTEEEISDYVIFKVNNGVMRDGTRYSQMLYSKVNSGEISIDENGDVEIAPGTFITFESLKRVMLEDTDFYYDSGENKYWFHKDLYLKHLEYLNNHPSSSRK